MKIIIHLLTFTLLFYTFPIQAKSSNYKWETTQLQKKDMHEEISFPAIVMPKNILPFYLLDGLPLKKVYVTNGKIVKKGDLLISYDMKEIKNQRQMLHKCIQELQNQEPIQPKETIDLPWFKKLFHRKKDENFTQIQNEWHAWKLQTQKKKLQELKIQDATLEELEKYQEVTAPFSGQITFQAYKNNQTSIAQEKSPLFSLVDTTHLDVVLFANIFQLNQLQVGDTVTVHWDNIPQKSTGTIQQISQLPDPDTQQYEMKINLSSPYENLHVGMMGTGKRTISSHRDTNTLPKECIVFENNETFVYTIQNGKIQKTAIQIGITKNADVEVICGVTASDIVLKSGLEQVYDGQVIQMRKD